MKNYIIPICALLMVGCGNRQVKQSTEKTITTVVNDTNAKPLAIATSKIDSPDSIFLFLRQYIPPEVIKYLSNGDRKNAINYIQSYHFDTVPYKSIKKIDEELSRLFKERRDTWDESIYAWLQPLADNRLQYHLNNPLTFSNRMPSLDSLIDIIYTPDGKYKFYSYEINSFGTMSHHKTYLQYRNNVGKITYKPWPKNLRVETARNIKRVWQFNYAGNNYYVIKSYRKGYSSGWYFCMEIVTIKNGETTFHTEFYPKGKYEVPENDICEILDEYGDVIGVYEAPAYEIVVCITENRNDIDYSFDPKTLTVYATTDDETNPEKTKHESWKLILPPLNKSE